MHKIVRETPPDPIKFMIRNLQRLDEKSKSSHVRISFIPAVIISYN